MNDSYIVDLLSTLDQKRSQKQLDSDIKTLEKTINMLHLTATLAQGSSKKEINAYIKQLSGQLSTIKLKAEIDSKNIKADINKALNNVSFKDIDALNIDENKSKIKFQKVVADAKSIAEKNPISIGVNIESKKNKLDNDLTTYLNKNTKITESSVLLAESNKVRDLIGAITDKKSLREATDAFQLYRSEVSATGFATKSTSDRIKDMFAHITKLGSIFSVTTLAANNFTKSLGTLKDIDDILTEISKTSNLTAQELEKLGDISFKSASKYGKTASDYLLGIQEMSRSGFYGEKGSAMAEQSLLAQAAGDMSADVANKYILATNAAYKYNGEAEKLNAVLDGQNSITNRNSVSLSDMAVAMSKAGTVASSYRVSIEDLSAMIGTMESVTKLGGSEIGNGIKAILINLQNVTSSKITDTLDAANASMTEFVNGTEKLRDPISILRDLADTFNQLDEDDALRAEILTNIGGKHQASKLAALLQNMELFNKMLVDYSDGAGSAMEEAMKSANNWSGKLNQLQNSWDSLVASVVSKDAVLGGLTFGDKMIQGIEGLIEKFGVIPTILTAVNSSMVAMNKDYGLTKIWDKETKKIDIEGNIFGIDISKIKNLKKHYEEAEDAIAIWNNKLKSGKGDLETFNYAVVQNSVSLKEYLSTCSKDAPASLSGYKSYLNAAGVSTDALRLKTILLNSAISMGIGIAIQAAVQGITYLIQKEENLRQAAEEAANAYKESSSSIDEYVSKYTELREALIKAKGNEEETYNVKKQLLDLQTELNEKFGDEYGQLNLVTDAYKDQTDALKAYNQEVAKTYLNENQKGIKNATKEMTAERQYNLGSALNLDSNDKWMALREVALQYNDKGIDLISDQNGTLYVQLTADAESAYEIINEFESDLREKAKELGDEHLFDSVLDVSSSQLNRAKETIEKYGEIYKQALMANLVSDDDKSETYNKALDIVEKYNEAVLKSEDPFTDEKVKNARQALKDIQDEISGDDSWAKYSAIVEDVFGQADTKLLDFNEKLQNDSGLQELATDLKDLDNVDLKSLNPNENSSFDKLKESAEKYGLGVEELIDSLVRLGYVQGEIQNSELTDGIEEQLKTFDQAWADSFTSEDDAVKELGNTLLDLAEQGRLTIETFNNADSTEYFKNLGISADEAVLKINKLVDESNQLSSMSSQISAMSEALSTKLEDGFVSADTLSGFDVEVRGLESWDRFQEVLGSTTSSYGECQEAANALATEWVNSSDFLAQLTAENMNYYETQLSAMGIINEEIVAFSALVNNTEALNEAGINLVNATDAQIAAFANEMVSAENTSQAIAILTFQKELCGLQDMNTAAEVANLKTLAENAGYTGEVIQYLTELEEIYQNVASGVYGTNNQQVAMAQERARQLTQLIAESGSKVEYKPKIDFSGATKAAGNAGKDAGEAYKDGLEEKLSDIKSIISSLSGAIDDQKEVISSQKEVALESIESQISALEEERDARLAVIEAEKAQLEAQIKAIDKQIDAKQKEIDAINDAAIARQHEIDLQKAQYELEKMQNQRTILQYSEDKGMHYVQDLSGISSAKEAVDDAKRQLEIDAIEREIDLLEESKDLLNEQIDLLDERADSINKFYDSQIQALEKQKESTEKYFESLIKSIEGSKDKYQELLDIVDKAELSGKLKQLGIDEEALLNGSEEEFEKLKNAYLDVVFQVNEGNEEMLSSLRELSGYEGTAPTVLTDTSEKLDEVNEQLDTSTESMDKLSTSATTASEGTSAIATSMGELNTSTEGLSDNLTTINDALADMPEAENINNIATAFTNLGEAVQSVANALGIGEEGAISTLVTALQEISTLSLDGAGGGEGEEGSGGGVITQFQNLKTAIEDATNAISGGGESGGNGDASSSSSPSMSSGAGADGEGSGGLLGAIGEIKSATDEALGGGGEGEESEGEGSGAIPQFQELKTAVDDVTAAIGIEGSEGEEGSGEGGENTLIGALRAQYETASEVLPETKALFEELLESIMACVSALNSMVGLMGSMSGIGGSGGISVSPHAKGTVGNAFANGTKYKGLPKDEKNALVSEYGQPEMTVLPNGKTILTDKPTMMDLPKDTVIFNEEQTKKIMDNKVDASGDAFAGGTTGESWIGTDDHKYRDLRPGDDGWDLMQAFQPLVDKMLKGEESIVSNAVFDGQRQMEQMIRNITTNTAITNNTKPSVSIGDIHVTCPGVTEQQVAEHLGSAIGKELDKQFSGFHNYTDQMSRIR